MNGTVNVKYRLSQAGQKAAFFAGRTASKEVVEAMALDDAAQIDTLTVESDGTLSLDVRNYQFESLLLDTPPSNLTELIAAWNDHKAAIDERQSLYAESLREREQEIVRQQNEKRAADAVKVEEILAEVEKDPLAALPLKVTFDYDGYSAVFAQQGIRLTPTAEQRPRITAIQKARKAAAEAKAAEKKEAEAKRRQEMVEEFGGYRWELAANMTDFTEFGLWKNGQDKRWVGTFSGPRGIDAFLPSPRGEQTYDVSGLTPCDCIQGGGYNQNTKGRRSNESEFFGVVVSRDEKAIVVDIAESRTEALAKAAKAAKRQAESEPAV